jgi:hypothetical protein
MRDGCAPPSSPYPPDLSWRSFKRRKAAGEVGPRARCRCRHRSSPASPPPNPACPLLGTGLSTCLNRWSAARWRLPVSGRRGRNLAAAVAVAYHPDAGGAGEHDPSRPRDGGTNHRPPSDAHLVCILRNVTPARTGSGQRTAPVFTSAPSDIAFPPETDTLPPFPGYAALPRSEYYGGSAPPAPSAGVAPIPIPVSLAGRRVWNAPGWFPRSLLPGRRVRHPALPLRSRHGYAAANSPWPPGPDFIDPARSSPPVMKGGCAPPTSPHPPGWSWHCLKRRNVAGFSRIPSRLAHRARPIRQC